MPSTSAINTWFRFYTYTTATAKPAQQKNNKNIENEINEKNSRRSLNCSTNPMHCVHHATIHYTQTTLLFELEAISATFLQINIKIQEKYKKKHWTLFTPVQKINVHTSDWLHLLGRLLIMLNASVRLTVRFNSKICQKRNDLKMFLRISKKQHWAAYLWIWIGFDCKSFEIYKFIASKCEILMRCSFLCQSRQFVHSKKVFLLQSLKFCNLFGFGWPLWYFNVENQIVYLLPISYSRFHGYAYQNR